ncbi:MAG: glutathione ABC transporter substrate-binding protein [Phototrophicales bacterium]
MKRLLILLILLVSMTTTAQDHVSVTMIMSRDPITLDPQGPIDPSAPVLLAYLYDTLVFQDEHGMIQPHLAQDWAVDGTTVTFNLRDDVVFSNGAPLNADSVIFTFQRLQEIGQRSFIYSEIMNISEFEKVDDYTVRFHLRQPSVTLLSALTYTYAAILEPGAVESADENYGMNPVGSGPFMLAEWTPQSSLSLVRNPNYAGHRPTDDPEIDGNIQQINIRFTNDQASRINALLSGEADIAYISSPPQLERLADNPDFTVIDDPTRGLVILGFNMARPPFNELTMRQAVAQAIDKQLVLDIAAEGMGIVVNTPIAPSIFGYNPELEAEALPYDPNSALELVDNTNYDGEPVVLLTSSFPTYQTMATVVQAQLEVIGIESEIQVLDSAGLRQAASEGAYDIILTRYDWNDPDLLRIYLGTDSRANRYGYSNPDLDALTAQGRAEFDPDVRYQIYTEAQRIVMADLPWVPLHMAITKVIIRSDIQHSGLLYSHILLEDAVR